MHSPYHITGGSSPLARGLRDPHIENLNILGIIPARAGFTYRSHPWPGRARDHPRSRGVYLKAAAQASTLMGSSPLARGLQTNARHQQDEQRIIPARAGFTSAGTCRRCNARDHPRSRGVYEAARSWAASLMGSSPLARGLPVCLAIHPVRARIIPARAGFT